MFFTRWEELYFMGGGAAGGLWRSGNDGRHLGFYQELEIRGQFNKTSTSVIRSVVAQNNGYTCKLHLM